MAMRMRWRIAVSVLVAAGGLTACASPVQTTGAAPSSSGFAATFASASPVATTTDIARRNVAQQLVKKLLADVRLPPGAQARPSAPASILADPGATQVSTNLVQAFGWFVVPGTEASVLAFETAHPLPGFSSSGIGHGSGPGFTEEDEQFTGTQTANYGPPIIDVEATTDGSSVAVRVNVGVIWRPVRTAAEHVPDTVTDGTAVLISSDPTTTVQLDQATARQFAAILDALDTQLPAERSCPPTPTTTITFTTGGQKLVFEAGPCGSVVVTVGGVSQPTLAEYTTSGTSTLANNLNSLFGIVTSPAPPLAASTPASASSSAAAPAVGDAAAISQCQVAENTRQASIVAAGGTTPALTIAAGFTTTEGDAHHYADSIGLRPGDPSPRPADSSSSYTNTTPVVACILDGYIPAPNLPGNPPYSREFALIDPSGTLDLLVAGRTNTISLQNPSSAMP